MVKVGLGFPSRRQEKDDSVGGSTSERCAKGTHNATQFGMVARAWNNNEWISKIGVASS